MHETEVEHLVEFYLRIAREPDKVGRVDVRNLFRLRQLHALNLTVLQVLVPDVASDKVVLLRLVEYFVDQPLSRFTARVSSLQLSRRQFALECGE